MYPQTLNLLKNEINELAGQKETHSRVGGTSGKGEEIRKHK